MYVSERPLIGQDSRRLGLLPVGSGVSGEGNRHDRRPGPSGGKRNLKQVLAERSFCAQVPRRRGGSCGNLSIYAITATSESFYHSE